MAATARSCGAAQEPVMALAPRILLEREKKPATVLYVTLSPTDLRFYQK